MLKRATGNGLRELLKTAVQCYAGYRGEETPRRFTLRAKVVEVTKVLDAWLAPDYRYFKVRGDDGACYILRNDVTRDRWELTLYPGTGAIGGSRRSRPGRSENAE